MLEINFENNFFKANFKVNKFKQLTKFLNFTFLTFNVLKIKTWEDQAQHLSNKIKN